MRASTKICSCATATIKIYNSSITHRKFSFWPPFVKHPCPHPQPLTTADHFSVLQFYLFGMNRIIKSTGFLSLTSFIKHKTSERFIHVTVFCILFPIVAEWYFIVWVCQSWCVHCPVERYLEMCTLCWVPFSPLQSSWL